MRKNCISRNTALSDCPSSRMALAVPPILCMASAIYRASTRINTAELSTSSRVEFCVSASMEVSSAEYCWSKQMKLSVMPCAAMYSKNASDAPFSSSSALRKVA